MAIRYSHSKVRFFTEALFWIILRKLQLQTPSSVVSIYLDDNTQNNNILRFQSQENYILFERVSNQGLANFFNENIRVIEDENLISCTAEGYLFEETRNSAEKKAKQAKNKMQQLLSGKDSINRDDIGCIFTELNNAGIVDKKTKQFFSSKIDVPLENLTNSSIQNYIKTICGAGGKFDEYLLTVKNQNTLSLNPIIRDNMKTWANSLFDCDVQYWQTEHWNEFNERWTQIYPYPPRQDDVIDILVNNNAIAPNLNLCLHLYSFLLNLKF